jgi:hypothetical protein
MTHWQVIPLSKQRPGKLMGGHWVVIQAYTVANQWTVAMLGEGGAKITAGYGNWGVVAVPRSVGITEWEGANNLEMDVDLMYDGWLAHPIFPSLPSGFTKPPKLPKGQRFQNRSTGRPVGAITKTKTYRPIPPPPHRPAHLKGSTSAVIGSKGGVHARALAPPQTRRPAPVRRRQSKRAQGVWIEGMLADLESLATKQGADESSHSVRLYGPVPHTEKRWVIQSLTWGDAMLDEDTGRRMRQQVTVHLIEHFQPASLRRLPRGKAAG